MALAWLNSLDDAGASAGRGYLTFVDQAAPTSFAVFLVTGSVVDGTGYRKITVTPISGAIFTNGHAISATFAPAGATGAIGATGATGPTGATGATGSNSPTIPQSRLTLESGVPISTSDQTAKSTIYWTPYNGSSVWLYYSSAWHLHTLSEISLALSSLTSSKGYDVFAYWDSGTASIKLELSAAWASDTARTDALGTQDGFAIKSGDSTRLHLGGFYTTGTSTTEDSSTKRYLSNRYNRTEHVLTVTDATASWTYTTATVRQANGGSTNQANVFDAVGDAWLDVTSMSRMQNSTAGVLVAAGIGIDATNALTGKASVSVNLPIANYAMPLTTRYIGIPGLGRHYASWNEYSDATGTTTWYGGTARGLTGSFRC